jgi:hypothetical protein
MEHPEYAIGDIVKMKKPHPCGVNAWKILRIGMDVRLECTGCGRYVLLPRARFNRALRGILQKAQEGGTEEA